jgi:16S rRNA (uracil1498-N3)-methyltransferase
VTAPRFLLDRVLVEQPGDVLVLEGAQGRHAATVRRIRAGERIDVTDGCGGVAECQVRAVARDRMEAAVLARPDVAAPALRYVLVQALAKGGRDERAIEAATELGVDAVVPWQSARAVVVWSGDRGARGRHRWVATVREAAKQSRRAWVPPVHEPADTADVAQRLAAAAVALVLDEQASLAITKVFGSPARVPDAGDVVLVVGPEGGLTDDERADFRAAGATSVRLGPHILRSSTAGPAAIAALSVLTGRW